MEELALDLPRVSPVGILERPEGFTVTPRRFSPGMRALCLALLLAFALVTVATTVASLGAYCLTTEPGDVRTLPAPSAAHSLTISRSSTSKTRVPGGLPCSPR
jgi:hypothetical protein